MARREDKPNSPLSQPRRQIRKYRDDAAQQTGVASSQRRALGKSPEIQALQRLAGNRAVTGLLRRPVPEHGQAAVNLPPSAILGLQRTVGNAAVASLLTVTSNRELPDPQGRMVQRTKQDVVSYLSKNNEAEDMKLFLLTKFGAEKLTPKQWRGAKNHKGDGRGVRQR